MVVTASEDDGGSAVTGYVLRVQPGSREVPIAASRPGEGAVAAVVDGLVNGQAYTLAMAATNAVGRGPFSAESTTIQPTGE